MPYIEPYKQELEDLPESLPAPEAVSQTVTTPAPPQQGFVEMGGGRYLSRFARGRLSFPLTSQQTLSVRADYSGMEGFTPFADSDVSTPSDVFDGTLLFESRHDGLAFTADVHGQAQDYTLYGLPSVLQDTSETAPGRSGYTGGTSLRLRTFGRVESSVDVAFNHTRYTTQQISPAGPPVGPPTQSVPSGEFRENRLSFDGSITFPLGATATTIDALAHRSSYGGDEPSTTGYRVDSGLSLHLVNSDFFSAELGGRFLGFEAPFNSRRADGATATAAFIAPAGRLELSLSPGITLVAENKPTVTSDGLTGLYALNPYAEHAPSVRPTLYTTKAESGFLLSLGPVRFEPFVGYQYAPNYQYFRSPNSSRSASGTPFPVEYASAQIIHGGAEVALQGVTGVEASVGVAVRDGSLQIGDDAAIPYFSPLVADAMLSVSFADQKGLLQTTGTFESPRPTGPSPSSEEVGTFVSFNVEGSYALSSLLDAVVRIEHLGAGAPEKWARYPRPPATFMAGFRIHW
jgi:hypothetical protein